MKDKASKAAEAKRLLQDELSKLVKQVKATVDKEEAALARIHEVLKELDALEETPPEKK
jgi:hypothetical protein